MEAFNDSDSDSESSDEEEEEDNEPTESSESEEIPKEVPKEDKDEQSKEAEDDAYLDSLIAEAEKEQATLMGPSGTKDEDDPAFLDLGSLLQINTKCTLSLSVR